MASSTKKIQQSKTLRWVNIDEMKVSPVAQRDLKPAWVAEIVNNFKLESLGTIHVNFRDGAYFIVDGQHRIEALREIGWGDRAMQVWYYENLTEPEEAELFLQLNNFKLVGAFDKFRVGMEAGRDEELAIDRIVRSQGLRIASTTRGGNCISAVGTLRTVYNDYGGSTLAQALGIVYNSWGSPGLTAPVIGGIAAMCYRYGSEIKTEKAIESFRREPGGLGSLLTMTDINRRTLGGKKSACVAEAAVDIINKGRGGRKLPTWRHYSVLRSQQAEELEERDTEEKVEPEKVAPEKVAV